MHYDTAATHSKRGVTALIYVTEDWQPGHGGELVLHPYPLPEAHVRRFETANRRYLQSMLAQVPE